MPRYNYTAIDSKGIKKNGKIVAPSIQVGKSRLKKMRYSNITLTLPKGDTSEVLSERPILGNFLYYDGNDNIQISLGSQAPTDKDIIVFTKQLSTMLHSGVPLIQSLAILKKQQKSKDFIRALSKIQDKVENGLSLSESMKDHPKIFDKLYVAMVSAGEKSGNLDTILIKLVQYVERAAKLKSQIKSASFYPLGVLFLATIIVAGLLIFVVPVFAQQYSEGGQELPYLTQIIINASDFLISNWLIITVSIITSGLALRYWKNTEKGKIIWDSKILELPHIGILLKKIAVGRFCSTMSCMLTSGVNLLEALSICAPSLDNKKIEKFVMSVRVGLERGDKFSSLLEQGNLFPEMVISMVTVGEATGALDDMLVKVSDFYEEEVDEAIEILISLIEPAMIVFIGGIVGFIVIAMYLPVFEMAGSMG